MRVLGVVLALGSSVSAVVASPSVAVEAADPACADVEFVGVRGSGETANQGDGYGTRIVEVRDAFRSELADTEITVSDHAVDYTAMDALPWAVTNADDFYDSVLAGVGALRSHLDYRRIECPGTRFVLAGYSQGAWVVADWLQSSNQPERAAVVGAVLLSDPTQSRSAPYNVGGGQDGIGLARAELGPLGAIVSWPALFPAPWDEVRVRSYCARRDPVCDWTNLPNYGRHTGPDFYVDRYPPLAGMFLAQRAERSLTQVREPVQQSNLGFGESVDEMLLTHLVPASGVSVEIDGELPPGLRVTPSGRLTGQVSNHRAFGTWRATVTWTENIDGITQPYSVSVDVVVQVDRQPPQMVSLPVDLAGYAAVNADLSASGELAMFTRSSGGTLDDSETLVVVSLPDVTTISETVLPPPDEALTDAHFCRNSVVVITAEGGLGGPLLAPVSTATLDGGMIVDSDGIPFDQVTAVACEASGAVAVAQTENGTQPPGVYVRPIGGEFARVSDDARIDQLWLSTTRVVYQASAAGGARIVRLSDNRVFDRFEGRKLLDVSSNGGRLILGPDDTDADPTTQVLRSNGEVLLDLLVDPADASFARFASDGGRRIVFPAAGYGFGLYDLNNLVDFDDNFPGPDFEFVALEQATRIAHLDVSGRWLLAQADLGSAPKIVAVNLPPAGRNGISTFDSTPF